MGNRASQYRVATYYIMGFGFPIDREEAKFWFEIAGANGHAGAKRVLGYNMFLEGEETENLEKKSMHIEAHIPPAVIFSDTHYGTIHHTIEVIHVP